MSRAITTHELSTRTSMPRIFATRQDVPNIGLSSSQPRQRAGYPRVPPAENCPCCPCGNPLPGRSAFASVGSLADTPAALGSRGVCWGWGRFYDGGGLPRGVPVMRWGRGQQCRALDGLLAEVRAGYSRVLVVRGEPGIGKTALLGYAARAAADFQVARAEGVESEMELPFAALQQLCGRMLGRLGMLPGPQRDALGVAFGLRSGGAPDRFLVGLAVLGLVSEVAAGRPLLCLVDDAQWLDQASAQALAFVARRLDAETVALLVGTRDPAGEGFLAGLPEQVLRGLPD